MTNNEVMTNQAPKLLTAIIDRNQGKKLEDILHEKHSHLHFMFHAMGTASSEILKAFGLSGTEKIVCVCIEPSYKIKPLMTAVTERMEMTRPGNGIIFVMPISGISAGVSSFFSKEFMQFRERWIKYMDQEVEKSNQDLQYELVVAIVNQGYSENVMDAAHAAGARGGTIIHARRTGLDEAQKFFGISLQEEKEIVSILICKDHKLELMQTVNKTCGMKTDAHGIVISLPVESCAGIEMDEYYQ